MSYRPQHIWNDDILTVIMDSTVKSGPDTVLARDTEFNTPKCIDSVLGASYLATYSAPSWTFTEHPPQPFTMATWTIGYAILNASTLHRAASYNDSTALQQLSCYTIMMAYIGNSPSPSARPTITMSYTLTPSINDIQTWNLT